MSVLRSDHLSRQRRRGLRRLRPHRLKTSGNGSEQQLLKASTSFQVPIRLSHRHSRPAAPAGGSGAGKQARARARLGREPLRAGRAACLPARRRRGLMPGVDWRTERPASDEARRGRRAGDAALLRGGGMALWRYAPGGLGARARAPAGPGGSEPLRQPPTRGQQAPVGPPEFNKAHWHFR